MNLKFNWKKKYLKRSQNILNRKMVVEQVILLLDKQNSEIAADVYGKLIYSSDGISVEWKKR